jgi:tetratricopeptide (TPR) repeat protein
MWALIFVLLLAISMTSGALAGLQSGRQAQSKLQAELAELSIEDQYNLALQDIAEGRLEVALQRLEYIVSQNPSYPGITEKLAEVMAVLYTTATPLPPAATITPTPTRDLRPVEDLFKQAQSLAAAEDWDSAIDTLVALRKEDPAYLTARVDGLLYVALRSRGVNKIWALGNLEGGTYDLALAANFGPLDAQAASARELARLYMIGSSFFEVHPEQAVYYFSQVASAAPGLRDASGITAGEYLRLSLIQYGDLLGRKGAWCDAQAQYQQALAMSPNETVQAKLDEAILNCSPPSATPLTETPTPTLTLPPGPVSETPTLPVPPSPTETIPLPPSETPTSPPAPPSETPTPTPTQEAPPAPTVTETPPQQPAGFTETPSGAAFRMPDANGTSRTVAGFVEGQPSLRRSLFRWVAAWL